MTVETCIGSTSEVLQNAKKVVAHPALADRHREHLQKRIDQYEKTQEAWLLRTAGFQPTQALLEAKNDFSCNDHVTKCGPLNMIDGGYTDNTGITRAVVEGASHLTVVGFYGTDLMHRFYYPGLEDEGRSWYKPEQCRAFKADKKGIDFLEKFLKSLEDQNYSAEVPEGGLKFEHFTVDWRKEFKFDNDNNKFLARLHMLKFSDLSVLCKEGEGQACGNRGYSMKDTNVDVVDSMTVVFIPQLPGWGIQNGCLAQDMETYAVYVNEIYSALICDGGEEWLEKFFQHC